MSLKFPAIRTTNSCICVDKPFLVIVLPASPDRDIFGMSTFCICAYGCLKMCFYALLDNFAKTMSPANLTVIARSGSKFCAKSWSQCLKMCRLDLKCHIIPESLERSSECHSNPAPGCEVRKLYIKYADGTPAKMRNAKTLLVAESKPLRGG